MVLPRIPETNVGEADAAPGEESSQTGKRLEPVESDRSTGIQSHESKRGPCEDEDGGPQRSASTVDVREEARGVTLFSERTQCTGSAVDTRETDGDDRHHDDDVGEVGKADDTSAISDDDKRRRFNVNKSAVSHELWVGVLDKQTHESQRQDVEQGDTPEDLLDRGGKRSCWVLGLGSSEADEFSSREGESSGNEDSTEANKIGECARV